MWTYVEETPSGYQTEEDAACQTLFDDEKHLALKEPSSVRSLTTLGYNKAHVAQLPTDFGQTTAFPVLSTEGTGVS